ncbi:MAG: adenylate/guanylate cyclase domain-containing protein [Phyllobacterium sp.]|uniref:AAA family ATPase n=1 Tax=Phyllobacterium sp. TaxID=1871046 RepID=UPI0030F20EE1
MNDVTKWLSELSLEHLASTFARSQIDFDSLRLLSDADLQEMQIPLGPRKKILAAIQRLNEGGNVEQLASAAAERRQLTILFCDLVGSTEYAVRLDPEDFSKLTRKYLDQCNVAVRNHNGIAANYIGDAFQALFGYPIAEEDDVERALELAFDILQIVPQIEVPDGPPLQVRIGIASGLVVVGDFLGAPAGVSTVALGSVPNLAQRLQMQASPQTILTDHQTYDATAGAFEFTDCGQQHLKGFGDEVHVWRAEKAKILESRFAKRTRLTDLVGRRAELGHLVAFWHEVVASNEGRVVLISGEPGIGKSRLVFEVQRRAPRSTYLTLQCAKAYSNTALFPFLTLLRRYAGISENDSTPANLAKLEAILVLSEVALDESLPIFAGLLSLDQKRYPPSELTSAHQHAISRRIFVDWLHHVARINPVLLAIEDEQWIDPSSSEVLKTLAEEAPSFPMLIVVTTREKTVRACPDAKHVQKLRLERLNDEEALRLVNSIAGGRALPGEINTSVVDKAEGVPLFVEELARSALEMGSTRTHAALDGHPSRIGVPSTLQSSLLSRLDRLGPGKAIAQAAAVIGREFDIKLLSHICEIGRDALEEALVRLADSGLVRQLPGRSTYTFSHALLQEAARGTLLRERYRDLHQRVAEAIETVDPRMAAEHPEVLAQHYAEAAMHDRAADCWLDAGLNVAKTWAKVEAANMFANGLSCLHKLPVSLERKRKELKLWLARGDVLYATYGYVTREGSEAYRNVMRLSEELGNTESPVLALDGLFGTAFNSARFADVEWASNQLRDIGEKQNSVRALVLGLQFKGMSLFSQGSLREAREHLERALSYMEHAAEVGSDFPSMSLIYLAFTRHLLGEYDGSIELYRAAERYTRQQSAYRLAACLGDGCILHAMRDDSDTLRTMTDELIPLAAENGLQLWSKMGLFFQGWAMVRAGNSALGLKQMERICASLGDQKIDKSCLLGNLAGSYIEIGDVDKASEKLKEALALVKNTGEHYFTAELLRLDGEIKMRQQEEKEALAAFRKAAAFARKQGAKSWELKAIESLAKLLRSMGKESEADRKLRSIASSDN